MIDAEGKRLAAVDSYFCIEHALADFIDSKGRTNFSSLTKTLKKNIKTIDLYLTGKSSAREVNFLSLFDRHAVQYPLSNGTSVLELNLHGDDFIYLLGRRTLILNELWTDLTGHVESRKYGEYIEATLFPNK